MHPPPGGAAAALVALQTGSIDRVALPAVGAARRATAPQTNIGHIALLGNYPPRRCGIATFTADTANALQQAFPDLQVDIYAMAKNANGASAPPVSFELREDATEDYLLAADRINASGASLLWVQHEYGIFGGPAGEHLLALLERVRLPVIATLHTVLERPDARQRRVTAALLERVSASIVMVEQGRRILAEAYGVNSRSIHVIPHGVPDRPLTRSAPWKQAFGWAGRTVILSFGLLSPSKGIELMIEALPAIAREVPDVLYVVLGATHPNLLAAEGETYRRRLQDMVKRHGLEKHVEFIDRYVENDRLVDYLQASDIYVTPYTNPDQITSGTLAYAVGLGKVVVSTPYVHAREILSEGAGLLIDFGDAASLAQTVTDVLSNETRFRELSRRAYARGRQATWLRVAEAAMSTMIQVVGRSSLIAGQEPQSIPAA